MQTQSLRIRLGLFAASLLLFCPWCVGQSGPPQLPAGTALPVVFTVNLNSAKARAGTKVKARTLQEVHESGGRDLPKGTLIEGEVVAATPKIGDDGTSILSFRLDRIVTRDGEFPVRLYVRALAGNLDSDAANYPTPPYNLNETNTRKQIGGDEVTPIQNKVYSPGGDVVGENLKEGVVERLVAVDVSDGVYRRSCDSTETLQAVAIYSGSACGVYGLGQAHLLHSGRLSGVVEIVSRHYTLKLYSGATALLQVAADTSSARP
jgi:hypothetical protein